MVGEFKIYSISDEYIDFLRAEMPNVYSNKVENRIHTRKYVGIVLKIEGYNYYVPMSSPKATDYQVAGDGKVIKKSIVPIMRIVVANNMNEKELKATLRISHMIPVPEDELELFDVDEETDNAYKDLIHSEILFIRKNKEKIASNAQLLYKQKITNDTSAKYVNVALNYKRLECLCDQFMRKKSDSKPSKLPPIISVMYFMQNIHPHGFTSC